MTGGNDDAGWRMDCKRWLADGERQLVDWLVDWLDNWCIVAFGEVVIVGVCW